LSPTCTAPTTAYDRTLPLTAFHLVDLLNMAGHGYICMVQDVRGRFGSEGEYETYAHDADDGRDTVDWVAAQPWCDGSVAMFGESYMAQVQWLAASRRPPALKAIAPLESPGRGAGGDRYRGGALQLGILTSWGLNAVAIPEVIRRAQRDPSLWPEFVKIIDDSDHIDELTAQLPLVPWPPIDERAGGMGPTFDRTARYEFHPPVPRFNAADIEVPALVFAGWYDPFLQPDLDLFEEVVAGAATEEARNLSRLIVGPWTHGDLGATAGEQRFGLRASSLLLDMKENITKLHRRWFDARLRGADTGIDAEPRVKVFVMGVNKWRELDSWPPPADDQEWYVLAPAAEAPGAAPAEALTDLALGGSLSRTAPVAPAAPSEFRLDPDDPVASRGGGLMMGQNFLRGAIDQLRTESRDDVLLFTSAALEEPLTVIGRVRLVAWVSSETPDTDVVARLCDVRPDGRSFNVVDGILRLRFREGLDHAVPCVPGEVYRVEVDLWSTAHTFLPGHRLRLQVCASDFPRYDRCPGSGETVAEATRILPQRNRLFHDPEHPTHLVLPIAK
jgi:uncharacterized protein